MHTDYKMPELTGDSPALIAFILLQEHLAALSEEDSNSFKSSLSLAWMARLKAFTLTAGYIAGGLHVYQT